MTTSYIKKVRRAGMSALIGYWPMNENDGTTAWDWGKSGGRNGTSSGAIPADKFLYGLDGGPCYYFDGSNDYLSVFSSALATDFNGAEGTFMFWAYSANWADSADRGLMYLNDAAYDDVIYLRKYTDNKIYFARTANGTEKSVVSAALTGSGWKHILGVCSETGDYLRLYVDGVSVGTPASSVGTYVSDPVAWYTGAYDAGTSPWLGWLQHGAVWNIALPTADIVDLAEIGP